MRLTVRSITTKSGVTITVPRTGVLCVVGGNNVGKSRFLAEVMQFLGSNNSRRLVVDTIDFELILPDDPEAWLRGNGFVREHFGQEAQVISPAGQQMGLHQLVTILQGWDVQGGGTVLRYAAQWTVASLDSAGRAGIAVGSSSPDMADRPGNIINNLFRDGSLEQQLSDLCSKTFGFPLTLDRVNGDVQLRVGIPSVTPPPINRPTLDYANAVAALPTLAEQGDGVKNYLGMILFLMTSAHSVVVVDEPEAFLHPAQARTLGRHLGDQAVQHDRQVLVATHDRDFVLGLLSSGCPTTFLRLDRDNEIATAAVLPAASVKTVWDHAALRYSNIMQGIFHRAVVVCEGDADCRWYAALLDEVAAESGVAGEEALLVPAGGKDQVPVCLSALDSLDVRSFAILDFDSILDVSFLKVLLNVRPTSNNEEMLRLASRVVSQVPSAEARKRAKESGLSGLPAGDATAAARRILDALREVNVLVVPVGELESFDREQGGHGPTWVTRALAAGSHRASTEGQQFVRPIIDAVSLRAP